jgi:hypothetical protein
MGLREGDAAVTVPRPAIKLMLTLSAASNRARSPAARSVS